MQWCYLLQFSVQYIIKQTTMTSGNIVLQPSIHWADILVFCLVLLLCLGIGFYYGWKSRQTGDLQEYFLGGRRLPILPVALSLFSSFQSAISIIGFPAEIYTYGTMFMYLYVGLTISLLLSCWTVVPMMYRLRVTSVYEYLQLRFKSKSVRMMGTILGMIQVTAYMGVTLYAPSLSLYTVANIPLWLTIIVNGLVGTLYTSIGGMRSVVWTDVLQTVLIFTGIFAIIIKGLLEIGGFSVMNTTIASGGRYEFDSISADPRVRHTVWGLVIGGCFTWLPNWCSQSSIQRVSSLKSSTAAKGVFLSNIPMVVLYGSVLTFTGLLTYTYYNVIRCDPVDSQTLKTMNQLMPFFAFQILRDYPGLFGIFICSLFSGALSTLSSGINGLAANTLKDLCGESLVKRFNVSATSVAKITVCIYGLVIIGIAFIMNTLSGPVTQMGLSVFGAFGGPLAGLFFLGGLFPQANWIGALFGTVTSLVLNIWVTLGAQIQNKKPTPLPPNPVDGCLSNTTTTQSTVFSSNQQNQTLDVVTDSQFSFYDISYMWYGFIGFFLTLCLGAVISLLANKIIPQYVEGRETNKELIFACCHSIWGFDTDDDFLDNRMQSISSKKPSIQQDDERYQNGKLELKL